MARPAPARRRPRARRPAALARRSGPRAAADALRLPRPPLPTAQYVPAGAAGGLLFVSGQDPEAGGRLVYRGQVGREVSRRQARAALRLATLNGLAAARAALGSLTRARRCVVLTGFVDMAYGAPSLDLCRDALGLIGRAFGAGAPPVVWLRPAHGLAGGMPVEVELVLELCSGPPALPILRTACGLWQRPSAFGPPPPPTGGRGESKDWIPLPAL